MVGVHTAAPTQPSTDSGPGPGEWWLLWGLILLVVGLPLVFQLPLDINPDTYEYLIICNSFLRAPQDGLHDTLTVGPVIPLLMIGIKSLLSPFLTWSRTQDILLLKGLALLAWAIVASWLYARCRLRSNTAVAMLGTLTVLVLMPAYRDTLSFNGELCGLALLALGAGALSDARQTLWRVMAAGVCLGLMVHDKLQVLPVALTVYVLLAPDRGTLLRVMLAAGAAALSVELWLASQHLGVFARIGGVLGYLSNGPLARSVLAGGQSSPVLPNPGEPDYVTWLLLGSLRDVPLLALVVWARVASTRGSPERAALRGMLPLLAVCLFCVALPGRMFEHYRLLLLAVLGCFLGPALAMLSRLAHQRRLQVLLAMLLMVLTLFRVVTVDQRGLRSLVRLGPLPDLYIGPDYAEALQRIAQEPGTVYLHGWGQHARFYLSAAPLWGVAASQGQDYVTALERRAPAYVVDNVGYPDRAEAASLQMSSPALWGDASAHGYQLVLDRHGLRVYRRLPLAGAVPPGAADPKP